MATIPRDTAFDNSLSFLTEGYNFISNRCDGLGTNMFETRLLGRKVFSARGEAAAELFYHPD